MQVKYVMTKKDLKQIIENKQKQGVYLLLIVASTYYIILNVCLSIMTFWLFYLSYAMFMVIIWLILDIVNKYYIKYAMKLNEKMFNYFYGESIVTINDNNLIQKSSHKEISIDISIIKKIIIRNNTIMIIPSKNDQKSEIKPLIFYQSFFSNKDDFDKFKDYFNAIMENKK